MGGVQTKQTKDTVTLIGGMRIYILLNIHIGVNISLYIDIMNKVIISVLQLP